MPLEINKKIENLKNGVDKKDAPIQLEKDILSSVQQSISKSIESALTGYNSPLTILIKSVIDSHTVELRKTIDDAFSQVIKTEEFKQSIISGFSHKISRTIISNNDGLFDKVSNELKQDPIFKAKLSLAVANVVEECLKEKNKQ